MRRQGRGSLSRGHRRPATHAARTGRRPSRRHRRYTSLSYNAHPEPHRYNAAYNAAVQGLATLGQPPDDAQDVGLLEDGGVREGGDERGRGVIPGARGGGGGV